MGQEGGESASGARPSPGNRGVAGETSRESFMSRVDAVLDPSYRLATVLLLDDAAAEDAVHEATLRAWRRYRRLGGRVTSFTTWFLGIVARQCRRTTWARRLTFRRRTQGVTAQSAMADSLMRLRTRTRASLFCYYFLDLPIDEVARVLGLSPNGVRSRIYRVEKRLQPVLEADEALSQQ